MNTRIMAVALVAVSLFGVRAAHAQTTLYTFFGDSQGAHFGGSVSGAGDVNGDGYDDFIVGAPGFGTFESPHPGRALIFSGLDGSVLYAIDGESVADSFGISVSGAGDVDGDGFADFVVGGSLNDAFGTRLGSARVFSGCDGSVLYTFFGDSQGDAFGSSVSGAGDVNGDGCPDLIVGARMDDHGGTGSGSARVFSGADGSILYTFHGASPAAALGFSVSGAGDVDVDGYADLIVGAYLDTIDGIRAGSATVFSGATGLVLYKFTESSSVKQLGAWGSGAGDVNGDGHADVVVGARFDDTNGFGSGSARVYSGADGSEIYRINGGSEGDRMGTSVSGIGDVNADGYDDFIVAAPGDVNFGAASGSVSVYSGFDGSVLFTFYGDSAGDQFGFVSGAGDVNGDGSPDLIIGVVNDDTNGELSGSVRVIVSPPALLIVQLIQDVVDLNLQQGINNSLDAKLDAVVHSLQDVNENNNQAAVNALQAFITQVQAQSGNQIPEAEAAALIASAQEIIDLLSAA